MSTRADRSLDVMVVALVGAVAGMLTGVRPLDRIKGTSTPYAVPMALALLKVPAGAVTAILGLLLLRSLAAGVAPAVDTSAGLLGWAVVLGLAQELVTRLADKRGQMVLDAVA